MYSQIQHKEEIMHKPKPLQHILTQMGILMQNWSYLFLLFSQVKIVTTNKENWDSKNTQNRKTLKKSNLSNTPANS